MVAHPRVVDWYTWTNPGNPNPDGPSANQQVGTYAWNGNNGLICLTNGTLWAYTKSRKDIYLCPTFAAKSVCGQSDAVRSYSMNGAISGWSFINKDMRASSTVLFGDDKLVNQGAFDTCFTTNSFGLFPTNEVGKWHNNGVAGNVVFVDGHVDKM